jgi:CRISPR/Cas system CMR subunit Cmr6 (Cas7 group RAMP superfamily)
MPPKSNIVISSHVRKKLSEVKAKYSSVRRVSNKQNNVFVKEVHYGLMSLQLKKSTK